MSEKLLHNGRILGLSPASLISIMSATGIASASLSAISRRLAHFVSLSLRLSQFRFEYKARRSDNKDLHDSLLHDSLAPEVTH